jgi:hypothetical protein
MAIKIPTYTAEGTITSRTGGVTTDLRVSPFRTPAGALEPISNFARDEYIKEKKLEADNKSTQILNDLYVDQKNEKGVVVAKGLMTIQSEIKQNENPTDASSLHDQKVNNLFEYAKNNKFQNLDNFTKKALERKYYATAGILKVKALEGSRLKQIDAAKDIDEDLVSKETLILKEVGPSYLPVYKDKILKRINNNPKYDDGVKKILTDAYIKFGQESLAASMSVNQPFAFKDAVEKGKFDSLKTEEIIKYSAAADKQIKLKKFQVLTGSLDLSPDDAPNKLSLAYEEIKKGTFGGNKELQKLYQNLSQQEKIEFNTFAKKKARDMRSDMQFTILANNQIARADVAQKSRDAINTMNKKKGIYQKQINELFGKTPAIVEQFKELNTKYIDKKADKITSFDKNESIIRLIMNDNINTVTEKFLLDGETEPKSIVQRVGETLNTKDLQYLNNLFVISDQENFKSNHNKFFEFLNKFKAAVSGSDALKDLDDTREERLSDFKYTMYNRYINGIQSGKTPEDLLTVNSKDFIGKDINKFIPNSDFVFKNIIKKIKKEKSDTPVALPPKRKPEQTTQEYQDSKEYQDYLKQKGQ